MTASKPFLQPVRGAGRQIRFLVLSLVLVCVWMIALPRISRIPAVNAHLKRLEEHGVNADAMFYTELNHSGRR